MITNVIKAILFGLVFISPQDPTEGQTNPYTGPTNAWTGPTNAPWTGPTNPWTGPTNPWTGPTNPPWTGPTNPWTGPTNPWTGTANAPATTTPTGNGGNGGGNPATPVPVATPSPQEGDNCYSFTCQGPYAGCYVEMGRNSVCPRSDQYCKVTVQDDREKNITTTIAECVAEDCEITRMSSSTKGDMVYGCCDSHLCNNETLLQLNSSPQNVASVSVLFVATWIITFNVCLLL